MKNYSYITLLTSDSYVYGVMMLNESLKQVNSQYPLLVLITNNVSLASKEILNQLNISYKDVETISIADEIYQHNLSIDPVTAPLWKDSFTKFQMFKLIEYDKLIFLDADILVLKNLDNLFELPHMTAAVDGEYFNLWPDSPHFNSGFMVIEPSVELFNNLIEFSKTINFNSNLSKWVMLLADQEILNLYYKDWFQQTNLHLNKYYNIFAPNITDTLLLDIQNNAMCIHFVGAKPWIQNQLDPRTSNYYYDYGTELIQNVANSIDWIKVRSKLILSVYAICKNEKDNVIKWLNSFGLADYVCVLDTGSTDGTWELLQKEAKKRKNLIIDQKIINPWRFDTARNESMKLIPKKTAIYFMADLDEIIKEDNWVAEVKSVWEPCFHRGVYTYHRNVDENDTILRSIPEYRIHNNYWYKYENLVHEGLINKAGQKAFYIESCTPMNITVWHYPKENKVTHYMELCEEAVKEQPDNWMMHLQLAIEYEIREETEKAKECFENILTNTTHSEIQSFERARCYFGLGRYYILNNQPAIASQYFLNGRLEDPAFVDNYLGLAEYYFNIQQFDKTIDLVEQALKNGHPSVWCSVYDINSYYCYYLLGLSYYNQKDFIKALAYIEIACMKDNYENKELINAKKQIAMNII